MCSTRTDMKKIILILITGLTVFSIAGSSFAIDEESLSFIGKLPPTKSVPLKWGKDPFVPEVSKTGSASPDTKLTAVFYNTANPSAIINDRIVYKGSLVAGQKVIDIGRTHVILLGETGSIRLELADNPGVP